MSDRCVWCQHTRGVHRPHCRIEAGCSCKEFAAPLPAQGARRPLPAPPGQPWPEADRKYAENALSRQERYGK